MDVVLEVFDTFVLDCIYANVLPIHPSASSVDPVSTIASSWKGYADINGTYAASNAAGGDFARSGWLFQPASQYLSVQPSEYAYMSRWDRDNIYRQAASLYLLTW